MINKVVVLFVSYMPRRIASHPGEEFELRCLSVFDIRVSKKVCKNVYDVV